MSLHGISKDAWKRFSKEGSWYYEITAPGFKYNMTDIAGALGVNQLKKADEFYEARKRIAEEFTREMSDIPGLILPSERADVKHSWHLYIIRIKEEICGISRNKAIEELTELGIGTSVHYTPLHMHPYYRETYGYENVDFPVASTLFNEVISLPLYPRLTNDEINRICSAVRTVCT
jgi:perosamine synthetase